MVGATIGAGMVGTMIENEEQLKMAKDMTAFFTAHNDGFRKSKVEHPAHYCEGRKYEPKDVIRDWGLNFNLGSAIKYISRAGRKDDIVQDLYKAKEFIQFEIEYLENEKK